MKNASFKNSVTFVDGSLELLMEDEPEAVIGYLADLNELHPEVRVAGDILTAELTLHYNSRADLKEFFSRQWELGGGPSVNADDVEDMMQSIGA